MHVLQLHFTRVELAPMSNYDFKKREKRRTLVRKVSLCWFILDLSSNTTSSPHGGEWHCLMVFVSFCSSLHFFFFFFTGDFLLTTSFYITLKTRTELHAAHSSVRLPNSYFQFRSSFISETLSDSRLRCPVRQVGIKFSRLHMKGFHFFFFSFLPLCRTALRSKAVIFYSQFFTYLNVCCLTPRDPAVTCFSCLLMSLRRAWNSANFCPQILILFLPLLRVPPPPVAAFLIRIASRLTGAKGPAISANEGQRSSNQRLERKRESEKERPSGSDAPQSFLGGGGYLTKASACHTAIGHASEGHIKNTYFSTKGEKCI